MKRGGLYETHKKKHVTAKGGCMKHVQKHVNEKRVGGEAGGCK